MHFVGTEDDEFTLKAIHGWVFFSVVLGATEAMRMGKLTCLITISQILGPCCGYKVSWKS